MEYNKLLHQRNRWLKSDGGSQNVLEAIDAGLSVRADAIHEHRSRLCRLLGPQVTKYYNLLSSGKEQVDLRYDSDLNRAPMKELLARSFEKDRVLMYTSVGIQRDDIYFFIRRSCFEVVRIARAAENVSAGPQTGAICFDKANERGGSHFVVG